MRSASFFSALVACVLCVAAGGAVGQEVLRGRAAAGEGAAVSIAGRVVAIHGIRMPGPAARCFGWVRQRQTAYRCDLNAHAVLETLLADRTTVCVTREAATAQCYVEGHDVGETLIAAGWAVSDGAVSNLYQRAEQSARDAQRGLWAGTFSLD